MIDYLSLIEKLGFPVAMAILLWRMVNENRGFMQRLVETTIKDNTQAINNLTNELTKQRKWH